MWHALVLLVEAEVPDEEVPGELEGEPAMLVLLGGFSLGANL